ncbi:RND transporter [Aliidongia dinghuensis]|uniref:RND transporter n=1 Tax=Aliidongia dinghuensis TaxID=1867774 RepID=A0A8J3E5N3_9PROT|nr:MMPL family transporter [Aliidongia dinghuensis]GGF37070.1 RND transporter [Aliidongia dinghuensis]
MVGLLSALVDFCRRHAGRVLLVALLLTVLGGWFAADNLGVNTDTSKLLSPDLPWQKQGAAYDAAFPNSTSLTTVVLDGKSSDAVEDATAALAKALADRTDVFKSVRRPDSGPFFNRYGLMFLSKEELAQLSDQIAEAQPLMGPLDADPSLRGLFGVLGQALTGMEDGEASGDKLTGPMALFAKTMDSVTAGKPVPVSWGQLMTGKPPRPEELRHFILVQAKLDFNALEPGAAASALIRQTAADLGLAAKGVTVRLTGEVPLEDEEFASVSEGAGTATAITVVVVIGILLWALRAPRLILAILVTLVVGLVLTAAFAAAAVGTLNMISIAFAVLFIGIGVDFGIQFSMRYRAELHTVTGGVVPAHRPVANQEALRRAARGISGPLGLAALATAVGFYSFLPTDYKGVSELGLIAGTSMFVALIANLTVLPALLTVLPARGKPEAAGFAWAAPIDRWLAGHAKPVLALALLLGVAGAASVPFVRFDADPLDLKDPSKESVKTVKELTSDPLASPYSIEILTPNLQAADALADKISALPEVRQALTLSSFIPDDQPAKLDILDQTKFLLGPILDHAASLPPPSDDEERAALRNYAEHLRSFLAGTHGASLGTAGPTLQAAIEHFLASPGSGDVKTLRDALLGGFEGRVDMLRAAMSAEKLTTESMPPEIRDDWIANDGRARVSVFPKGDMKDERQMAAFVAAVRKLAPEATGAPVSILESGKTVSNAFRTASLLALCAITVALAFILRRLRDVVLVVVPLALAGLYALGTSVAIGLAFNYANVIAVPLLMGIGVAFDIYFVMLWRTGHGPVELLQTSTARAVAFSAGTTGTAFGSLALSHHAGTASMGLLLMMSLIYVLVCTLIVQPVLMTVLGRGHGRA